MTFRTSKAHEILLELLSSVEPEEATVDNCFQVMVLTLDLPFHNKRVREYLSPFLIEYVRQFMCHESFSKESELRLTYLLTALASLQTSSSHQFLVKLLQSAPDVWLRAVVLEVMLLEGSSMIDIDLVLPYVSSSHQEEVLSALHALRALEGSKISSRNRKKIRDAIEAVDKSLSPLVEVYCEPLLAMLVFKAD